MPIRIERHWKRIANLERHEQYLFNVNEWILLFLLQDRSRLTVTGKDKQIIIEQIKFIANRSHDLGKIAAGKIRATDAPIEERIAAEDAVGLAKQADATGRMAGSMDHLKGERPKCQVLALMKKDRG